MSKRKLEASLTVIEAVARTEAILRSTDGTASASPAERVAWPARQPRRGFAARLDALRWRVTAWRASAADPGP